MHGPDPASRPVLTTPDLATLLRDVASGRTDALRVLYDAQAPRLFGIALTILRDRDAAADALHDAVLRVAGRAGQFDPHRGEARAWLGAIVRHAALDLARARGRETPCADPALGDAAVAPEALSRLGEAQDAQRLRDCLTMLDVRNRDGIVLAFVHGLSHAQIAARMEVPLGTVKAWIRRGLVRLRECLS